MVSIIKKLEQIIFYLVILFLPTQLGLHFWPEFSYVYGLRIDYLSPTLYLTDILIIFLILFSLTNVFLNKKRIDEKYFKSKVWIAVWFFSLIAGVVISKNPMVGIYGLLKIIEFTFLGIYAVNKFKDRNVIKSIISFLSISVIFESGLAIAQFINQRSINGIFYFFGERTFNGQTPGIANASLGGELILRPYATFSHPNVLAAFLLISIIFIYAFLSKTKLRILKVFYLFSIIIGSIALILTMSRVSIIILLCLGIFVVIRKYAFSKKIIIPLVIVFLILIFSPIKLRFLSFNFNDIAFTQRWSLVTSSLTMFKENIFLGTGVNNFLNNLPLYSAPERTAYLQPVHNIYLLVLAQTGIIGFIFFLWFLKKTFDEIRKKREVVTVKLISILTILILGLFDHFFFTLQQGQMLFAFVFAFAWSSLKNKV